MAGADPGFGNGGGGGGKILSVAHKSVADPGFEVTGAHFFRN